MKIKTISVKSYSKEESLLTSILMFIIGIILLTNPEGVIEILTYVLGGILIITGGFKFFMYKRLSKQALPATAELIKAIVYATLGVTTILFFNAFETTVRFIVAAYILYIGIHRLIYAIKTRKNTMTSIILSSITITFAVVLAILPGLSFSIVGLFIMGSAIIEMVGYIMYKSKHNEEEVMEAKIVNEIMNKEEE